MEIQLPSSSDSFSLIYDHEDFLVLCKKEGISFHTEEQREGLSFQVKQSFPEYELYPVHRLDKVTSGLILFAKSSLAANSFRILFEEHKIQKIYLALSPSRPSKKQGIVEGDMIKSRRGQWKLLREKKSPAKTRFYSYYCEQKKMRLFKLIPLTGRTHQLRVMMKSLGSPILGDTLYGGEYAPRCYLHAYQLKFRWNNRMLLFSNLPEWPCLELLDQV